MVRFDRLPLAGPTGSIPNTHLTQDAASVALVLPGLRGGWSVPAVYYPVLAVLDAGVDALCIEPGYSEVPDAERMRGDAQAAIATARGAHSGELLLVGKSIGTLAMAELISSDSVPTTTRAVWITPLLDSPSVSTAILALGVPGLVIIGTADRAYDAELLKRLAARNHRVSVLEGANHALTVPGDARRSAAIPSRLVEAVASYLDFK